MFFIALFRLVLRFELRVCEIGIIMVATFEYISQYFSVITELYYYWLTSSKKQNSEVQFKSYATAKQTKCCSPE